MNLIIFGIGRIFSQYHRLIKMDDVQCFFDNGMSYRYMHLYGKPVLPPERITEYEYDYIVLFNQNHAREIYDQLVSLGCNPEKIISWQYYIFFMVFTPTSMLLNCFNRVSELVEKLHLNAILDIDSSLTESCIGVGERKISVRHGLTDYAETKDCINKKLYDAVLENFSDLKIYDAVFMLDYFISHSVTEAAGLIRRLKEKTRYFILAVPYAYPDKLTEWAEYDFSSFGKVKFFPCQTIRIAVIDTKETEGKYADIKIYVVTHKVFCPPVSPMYIPVFAGKDDENEMHIAGDATGDSISELNPLINECTALYWIWKNTDSDYAGLCHYRRYFSNGFTDGSIDSFNLLDDEYIHKTIRNFDFIVTKACVFPLETVKEQLRHTLCPEAFCRGFGMVRSIIAQKYPDYLHDFDGYFNGHYMYPCNMFITSRRNLQEYCRWLFDIIIPAARSIDVSSFDSNSKRVIGFMAERLLTLWILHNGKSVKEVDMLYVSSV